jgi:hypothetical protein
VLQPLPTSRNKKVITSDMLPGLIKVSNFSLQNSPPSNRGNSCGVSTYLGRFSQVLTTAGFRLLSGPIFSPGSILVFDNYFGWAYRRQ